MKNVIIACGLILGIAASVFGTFCHNAWADRNTAGTYSLPSGNPVITGTTITSTWANTTLNDIKAEITNSLDRNGHGAMLNHLQLYNGNISAPALTWGTDVTSGLYKAGSSDFRFAVSSTDILKFLSTGPAFPVGLTATQTGTNTTALTATGNGTAAGITATGGASGGVGVFATGGASSGTGLWGQGGSTDGTGVVGKGAGTSPGVDGTGGATGNGGNFNGGATSGYGVRAIGGSNTAGGFFQGGSANAGGVIGNGVGNGAGGTFTGGASGYGVMAYGNGASEAGVYARGGGTTAIVSEGSVYFNSSNPANNTGFTNSLTPRNTPKAWGNFTTGPVTYQDGFNISGCALVSSSTTVVECTMANALASVGGGSYSLTAMSDTPPYIIFEESSQRGVNNSKIRLRAYNPDIGGFVNLSTTAMRISFNVQGVQ